MSLRLTSSQLSVASAIALIVGGIALSITSYQNIFAPTVVIAALIGLWFSQNPPRPKLSTVGLLASIVGILFVANSNVFPVFREIRNTNPTAQPATNLVWYYSGATFFCGMVLIEILGFIFLGISILRSSSLPKASGRFFILAGIFAFASWVAGIMVAASGFIWLHTILEQQRLPE